MAGLRLLPAQPHAAAELVAAVPGDRRRHRASSFTSTPRRTSARASAGRTRRSRSAPRTPGTDASPSASAGRPSGRGRCRCGCRNGAGRRRSRSPARRRSRWRRASSTGCAPGAPATRWSSTWICPSAAPSRTRGSTPSADAWPSNAARWCTASSRPTCRTAPSSRTSDGIRPVRPSQSPRPDLGDEVVGVAVPVAGSASGDGTVPAVPYHAWANRGVGGMRVWLPR